MDKDIDIIVKELVSEIEILGLKKIAIKSKITSLIIFICLCFVCIVTCFDSLFSVIAIILCLIFFIILTMLDIKKIK